MCTFPSGLTDSNLVLKWLQNKQIGSQQIKHIQKIQTKKRRFPFCFNTFQNRHIRFNIEMSMRWANAAK